LLSIFVRLSKKTKYSTLGEVWTINRLF
jgi:hypothetical protein